VRTLFAERADPVYADDGGDPSLAHQEGTGFDMSKKFCLGLTALAVTALSAPSGTAATITLNSTCSFAKAVAWINTGTSQTGCTKSGTIGSNDKIIVGLNNQEFTIDSTVEIKKSMTVQSWSFYGTLKTTNTSTTPAIKIAAKDILVQFTAIILRGVANNTTTGIHVDGTNDTVDPANVFAPKLILTNSRITGFRRSGMHIHQGNVDAFATTFDGNSNLSSFTAGGGRGGAVRIESAAKIGRFRAEDCYFSGNTAKRGGAIYNHGNLQIVSGQFYDNVATYSGNGTGAAVFAEFFPTNYYTAFAGGGHFENNQADAGDYSIAGGANAEFSGTTPFTAVGNTTPLCENPIGAAGCPTQ
jgi:predicted outer membrane repeat protein